MLRNAAPDPASAIWPSSYEGTIALLKRVVSAAAITGLISGAAYAQDEQAANPDCEQQLMATQALVQAKVEANALSEEKQEAIYEILDNADALCADGKSDEANEALAKVATMFAEGQ